MRVPRCLTVLRLVCGLSLAGNAMPLAAQTFFQKRVTIVPPSEAPSELRSPAKSTDWNSGTNTPPLSGMKQFARESNGAIWLGSDQGAARFDPAAERPWDRWQFFTGPRWLADDSIVNIWVDSEPSSDSRRAVWILTRNGASRLSWDRMDLEDKARHFEEQVEARHVRHGFVADTGLSKPGDLQSSTKHSSDNDGLWTAMYLGAESYRFAVTHEADARRKALRAWRALMRLESITGIPGFYARSFIHRDEPKPGDGEWHPTPDGEWLWKGDTSSDESVGHYYGYALFYDLVANPEERETTRAVVRRITDYLIEHDYDMPDLDGKPTRWGQWSERYFATEEGEYESALRSLELLAFLKTAHHITGDPAYEMAYRDRVHHGYARRILRYRRWPGGGEINFSDDELAYLSFDPLLRYETDPELRAVYLDALQFTWSQIRSDRNPLWNYISAASGAGPLTADLRRDSQETLERIPWDLITWPVHNSHRGDLQWQPGSDRFGRRQLKEVLPPDERPLGIWNSNPYRADANHGGHSEEAGTYFLLPYWLGRFEGYLP